MKQKKFMVLKNTGNPNSMIHEEIHGQLVEGDSIVVEKGQEAAFLHDDGHVAAIYKNGTFVFRDSDKWDHRGRLFYIDYSIHIHSDWHASIFLTDEQKRMEVWGSLLYCPENTELLIESLARRDLFGITAFKAERRLTKIILRSMLPLTIKNSPTADDSWKPFHGEINSISVSDIVPDSMLEIKETAALKESVMQQLSMFFASNGLLLSDLSVTRAVKYDVSNGGSDVVDIDGESADASEENRSDTDALSNDNRSGCGWTHPDSSGADRGPAGSDPSGADRGQAGSDSSGADRGPAGSGSSGSDRGQAGSGSSGADRGQAGSDSSGADYGPANSYTSWQDGGWTNSYTSWLDGGWANSYTSWQDGGWANSYSSWQDGGWANSYSSWLDGGWANFNTSWTVGGRNDSAEPGSGNDRGKTAEKQDSTAASETEAFFRAATPKGIMAGESFPLVITMFTPAFQKEAEMIIQSVSDERTEVLAGLFEVKKTSHVSVQLFSKDIPIEDDLCEQDWNGKLCTFHFLLDLPENYTKNTIAIRCRIYINKVHLSDMVIVARVKKGYQELEVEMKKYLTAFASYSSKDRAIVASRLQGMLAATNDQMDIFFDVESLHTGEDWETRIRNEIRNRSIFYLFWSRNARMSEWVQRELSMALELKDLQDIEPVPLEAPDVCPPPESLRRKHFFNCLLNYAEKPIVHESGPDEAGEEGD